MPRAGEVLEFLIPQGGWVIYGEEYEGIQFIDCEPITKQQFEAGFAEYKAWKTEQEATKQAKRDELLNRLGITAEEAKLLLA